LDAFVLFIQNFKLFIMACEICGRNACTRSFHSIEDQSDFDGKVDILKESIKNKLLSGLKGLKDYYDEEDIHCVSFSDVESLIEDVLW
jgi:hypothetical protein